MRINATSSIITIITNDLIKNLKKLADLPIRNRQASDECSPERRPKDHLKKPNLMSSIQQIEITW